MNGPKSAAVAALRRASARTAATSVLARPSIAAALGSHAG
jgi:hypothetical protein